MLADSSIKRAMNDRSVAFLGLRIEPFNEVYLNPASVDLTLSPIIRVFKEVRHLDGSPKALDLGQVEPGHTERVEHGASPVDVAPGVQVFNEGFALQPGAFILAATNEVVRVGRHLAARVEGKSSLGRLGLAVHITAGFIDPGFEGSITLEVANLSPRPLLLRPHMRIAQIAFEQVQGTVDRLYGKTGHYQGQPAGEPVESRYVP